MIDPTVTDPYLFVEIWVPKRGPYRHATCGWPTIVGDIVKPLKEAHSDILVWFLQEGPWWQLCFSCPDLANANANDTLRHITRQKGFHIKRYIKDSTLGEALGGTRWLPRSKRRTGAEKRRSLLLCQACHAVCSVYLDALVRKGRRWVVEAPQCTKQNPHGNLFESFMHLVANISEAKFDVLLQARTRWMHKDWQETRVTCHL